MAMGAIAPMGRRMGIHPLATILVEWWCHDTQIFSQWSVNHAVLGHWYVDTQKFCWPIVTLFQFLIRLAHFSVRDLWNGRRVCLSVVCLSRVRSRKLGETGAKFRHLYMKPGSESENVMSDFAPEVAKYHRNRKWPKMGTSITNRDWCAQKVCKPTVSLLSNAACLLLNNSAHFILVLILKCFSGLLFKAYCDEEDCSVIGEYNALCNDNDVRCTKHPIPSNRNVWVKRGLSYYQSVYFSDNTLWLYYFILSQIKWNNTCIVHSLSDLGNTQSASQLQMYIWCEV